MMGCPNIYICKTRNQLIFNEAIYGGDGSIRLATAHDHLNECSWTVVSERDLKILYRCMLRRP